VAGSIDHLGTAALALDGISVWAVHRRESLLDWECFLMFVSDPKILEWAYFDLPWRPTGHVSRKIRKGNNENVVPLANPGKIWAKIRWK
jgi:hypothetical protein